MRPVVFDGCFGWLHTPAKGSWSDAAALLCPGLGQDANTGHRSFRLLADRLAAAGCPTLRFDYPGTGDSCDLESGDGGDAWQSGIDAAANWLRATTGARRIVMFGLRFGATLAAITAERRDDIAGVVLLAPILRGRPYVSQLAIEARLRRPTPGDAASGIEVGELRLSGETLHQIKELDLRTTRIPFGCQVAIYSRTHSQSLASCEQSWRHGGAVVASHDFAGLDALLRPSHLAHEPDADFSGIMAWLDRLLHRRQLADAFAIGRGGSVLQLNGCTETAILFGDHDHLCGILCRPTRETHPGLAVVIGNTGGNPHHGFARYSVEFARALAVEGIASFRIDFAGLGDSVALAEDGEVLTHVLDVDRVPDMSAALDALERLGYSRFAAQGLCSGAYHGLQAGAADPRFNLLLLVNLPGFTLHHEDAAPSSFARRTFGKLDRREAWTLLLYGEGDSGLIRLKEHFGQGGAALAEFIGVTVSILPGLDHELTGSAMRRSATDRMIGFLLDPEKAARS